MTRFLVVTWLTAAAALTASAQSLPVVRPAADSPAAAKDGRFFELRTYYASAGKLGALDARFRDHAVRLFEKHGMTNLGYWTPLDDTDDRIIFLLAYPSRAARDAAWNSLVADPEWIRILKQTDANGRLVERIEREYLVAADYSPVVTPTAKGENRVYELRYCVSADGNLEALHTQCRKSLKALENEGVTLVGAWTLAQGQREAKSTVICLLARKPDPPRDRVSARSMDPTALLTSVGPVSLKPVSLPPGAEVAKWELLRPTDYSPLR